MCYTSSEFKPPDLYESLSEVISTSLLVSQCHPFCCKKEAQTHPVLLTALRLDVFAATRGMRHGFREIHHD